jgi:RND family efflux transporter MFP subunit
MNSKRTDRASRRETGETMTKTQWIRCLLAIIVAGMAAGCGPSHQVSAAADAPTAAVVKVTRQDLSTEMEIASDFLPYQEIEMYAKVSGYIQKLYVDWGTHVKQGQLLATLEIPELVQQLQQDEATVHRSQSELERAREDLNRNQSAYNVAHLAYSRLADVQKSQPGLVAQQDLDASQGKDIEANAGVAGAKDALAAAEQALLAAQAALQKDKAMYEYAHIVAPFDGVVTRLDSYTGALLPAGTSSDKGDQALCRLSQNDRLRLVIPVPERAVPDLHLGESIAVDVSALNRTFPGKITRLAGQIDTETRTMHTEVEVSNPKYELVPGMYASVKIPLHTAQQVLAVPVQAVQSTGEGKGTVLVVNASNRIERRNVMLGLQTSTQVEVVSGLHQNESVIFGSQGQYQPNELVTPKTVDSQEAE